VGELYPLALCNPYALIPSPRLASLQIFLEEL